MKSWLVRCRAFSSKMGRPFAAVIKLSPEFKLEFDFGQAQPGADGSVPETDFTGQGAGG